MLCLYVSRKSATNYVFNESSNICSLGLFTDYLYMGVMEDREGGVRDVYLHYVSKQCNEIIFLRYEEIMFIHSYWEKTQHFY